MLQKIIFEKNDIIKIIIKLMVFSLLCFTTCLLFFCFAAAVVSKVNFSYGILYPVTAAILGVSSFTDGFVISRWFKENGLICGILAGFIIFSFLIIVSMKFNILNVSNQLLIKLCIVIFSGAIGGIIGVNTN